MIMVVAYSDQDPTPTLERDLNLYRTSSSSHSRTSSSSSSSSSTSHNIKAPLAEMHLVLVHAPEQSCPVNTSQWLRFRSNKIKHHHHIKVDRIADFQRLGRVITGQTVGVVLSGGGARGEEQTKTKEKPKKHILWNLDNCWYNVGLAHLGVLRGLMEMGVPIDAVGGTSMGSQIAGLIAQGWDVVIVSMCIVFWLGQSVELDIAEMMRRLEDFYVRGYFRALLWDISIFPYIALLTGEAFVNRLRRLLGRSVEIEDLCNFGCDCWFVCRFVLCQCVIWMFLLFLFVALFLSTCNKHVSFQGFRIFAFRRIWPNAKHTFIVRDRCGKLLERLRLCRSYCLPWWIRW
jgi:hypothetical protein